MWLSEDSLRRLIVEGREAGRFTQDSPVMPAVWLRFADPSVKEVDILLTPAQSVDPAALASDVRERLGDAPNASVAYSGSYVAATLSLDQLVHAVLPLSDWWAQVWGASEGDEIEVKPKLRAERLAGAPMSEVAWLARVLGAIDTLRDAREDAPPSRPSGEPEEERRPGPRLPGWEDAPIEIDDKKILARGRKLLGTTTEVLPAGAGSLWRVTLNRPAYPAVFRSRATVKADAVTRLFDVDCSGLTWAIVDTGIDATHPAFRSWKAPGEQFEAAFDEAGNHTRVEATYDLTRLRIAQRAIQDQKQGDIDPAVARIVDEYGDELESMRTHLLNRRPLDWTLLEPLLRVPHTQDGYTPPVDDHGTHVAGILAADWPDARAEGADYELVGLCPDLRLYDLRVFPPDHTPGDEFTVSAALQFVDYLNGFGRKIAVAGANVSLSVPYELSAFGCGQTPVCQEANRLVSGGVVVVAAAGNRGREEYILDKELIEGFRMISLTDPGNAEDVITVGATHATNPHAYGVSYFSSRGPTGDGRRKPDLVAPGEKIQAPAVGHRATVMDGTSQAAPHVSGAAALLLARHRELIGKPQRVKRLLMDTATDLEREPYFQGAGLVDALRAAQAN